MTDFWENFNEGIEDNAGLLGAAGGLAALKGQQAQKEKLSAIEAQLQKAESRVEKEAHLKRKLVALEEVIEEALESDSKLEFFIQYRQGFANTLGKPSELLTSIDDIKYARSLEKKATQLDEHFPKIRQFLSRLNEKFKTAEKQSTDRINIDAVIEFENHDAFIDYYRSYLSEGFEGFKSEIISLAEELELVIAVETIKKLYQQNRKVLSDDVIELLMFFNGGMHHLPASNLPIKIEFGKAHLLPTKKARNLLNHECFRSEKFKRELSVLTNEQAFTSLEFLKESIGKSNYFKRCYSSGHFNDVIIGSTGQKAESGCFIATAVYGDYDHPQVLKLRNFRDSTLRKSLLGRCFISFYYTVGPHLAVLPDRSVKLRRVLRSLFDCL